MNKVPYRPERVSVEDSNVPRQYADLVGGLINRCSSYSPEYDIYGFEQEVAKDLYGGRVKDIITVYDKILEDE